MTAAAASIPGLQVRDVLAGRDAPPTSDQAAAFDQLAEDDQVKSTPTILVGKSGETPRQVALSSPADVQSVAAALDDAVSNR